MLLREHRRVLQLFTEALAARRLELRSTEELPELTTALRPQLPSSSVSCVFLPPEVDAFSSRRLNFAVYKVAILHQLGFWECGTFDFDLAAWMRRRGSADAEPRWGEATHLGAFFASQPRPALARRLFSIVEDTRIDAWIRRTYKGMRRDLDSLMQASLDERPRLESLEGGSRLLEVLVRLSLGAEVAARRPAAAFQAALDTVRAHDADVYTTAAAVVEIAGLFGGDVPARADEASGPPARARPQGGEKGAGDQGRAAQTDVAGDERPELDPDVTPVPYRGELEPERVQKELLLGKLRAGLDRSREEGLPLPPELLHRLLEESEIEIRAVDREELGASSGLPASEVPGAVESAHRQREIQAGETSIRTLEIELEADLGELRPRRDVHYYDEWDCELQDYRRAWCRLVETRLEREDPASLEEARSDQARLCNEIRRQFELLRPDSLRRIRRLTDGEEIDLDAAVEAHTDRRAGESPSEKVYLRRSRRERDVAAAFLLDMSASTDSEITSDAPPDPATQPPELDFVGILDDDPLWSRHRTSSRPASRRRVIDVEKEALVLMAEALDALGDVYAVYGFSGYGRTNVEFYVAKDFGEPYDQRTLERIAAIRPKRSTRMGPAIRHAMRKLGDQEAAIKVLLVLSDGYPQDFDYGRDRTSRVYGIQDTMMALREARLRGIHTFCITVDPAGHDYLREMCPERRYLVIDEIAALPRELPKVYRGLTATI